LAFIILKLKSRWRKIAMAESVTYRARLRFRVQKKLDIKAHEHKFMVHDREVVLAPALPDVDICDSEWLVLNTRGFAAEEQARDFGHKLRAALEVSSVSTRVGVDAGRDIATSRLGHEYRKKIEQDTGLYVRDNVHGVDVFIDNPNVRIANFSATGIVRTNADPFLVDLDGLLEIALTTSPRTKDVILLLNAALIQPHPVAQIVFAFSAVEMLGQEQAWTDDQECLLSNLTDIVNASTIATPDERREVADAIRRSHRLSLRQGVLRLLDSLGLADLKPVWDSIYGERSTLVHGLAPQPGADYTDLANRAVSLCGRILLKSVASEIVVADRYVDKFYVKP
jgi:hypothetical protein